VQSSPEPVFRTICDYLRRSVVATSIVLWLGGFTFYSIVVVHTAHRILRSHVRVGMVTQVVTHWLNAFGVAMILALLWNLFAEARSWSRWMRRIALATWAVMAAAQLALICLHPMMDAQIDSDAHELRDRPRFHEMHQLYLTLSTAQWAACIVHGALLVWPRKC